MSRDDGIYDVARLLEIVELHGKWLLDLQGGKRALLGGACLRGVHLEGVNLGRADLRGADLTGAHLQGACFSCAVLEGADFSGAYLEGSNLGDANLRGARFREAHLEGACLSSQAIKWQLDVESMPYASPLTAVPALVGFDYEGEDHDVFVNNTLFDGADFSKTSLQGADLRGAVLTGVELRGANLRGAKLKGAEIEGANLTDGYLDEPSLGSPDQETTNERIAAHEKWLESDGKAGEALNLEGANLAGFDLRRRQLARSNLSGANLRDAQLAGADLKNASLAGVALRGGDLSEADLRSARLSGARLISTCLEGSNLEDCQLEGAVLAETRIDALSLERAHLQGAVLMNSWLFGAFLTKANLDGADLTDTDLAVSDLSQATLRRARMSHAELHRANMCEADLGGAELNGASLIEANLSGANLEKADLRKANLWGAKLRRANLRGVKVARTALLESLGGTVSFVESQARANLMLTLPKSVTNVEQEVLVKALGNLHANIGLGSVPGVTDRSDDISTVIVLAGLREIWASLVSELRSPEPRKVEGEHRDNRLKRLAESRKIPESSLVTATELFRFPGLPLIDLSLLDAEISTKNAALVDDAPLAEAARDFQTVRAACKRGIVSELQLVDTDMQPIELEEEKKGEEGEREADLGFTEDSGEEDEEIKEKLTEAEVFERYDLTGKAIETLKGVLDKHPGNENARRLLEELYLRIGMDEEADRLEQED